MATQAAMIMDTIMGMKRVLEPQIDSSDSDEPYLQPPNRGQKLKRKSQYTADGQPIKKKGRETYTTTIEHAGYRREILHRNPKRYDEDGDELDPLDEDLKADELVKEGNPSADIYLETLLAPLTSAAHLADHPSLSAPYLSSTLSDMVRQACSTMHREKKTVRNAKLLLRKLRGDEVWIPTEVLNAASDEEIFDTDQVFNTIVAETAAGRINGIIADGGSINGDAISHTVIGSINSEGVNSVEAIAAQEKNLVKEAVDNLAPEDISIDPATADAPDMQMANRCDQVNPEATGTPRESAAKTKNQEDEDADTDGSGGIDNQHRQLKDGTSSTIERPDIDELTNEAPNVDVASTKKIPVKPGTDSPKNENGEQEAMDEDKESDPAPEPRRMRTRAQAAATSEPAVSSHTASPEAPSIPPPIHPLFQFPPSAKSNADYGLPPLEADETRRMLMVYVQKQEEVCRSAEKLYQNLLRANRQRITVLTWSKAEGHVGELSDGEDWCDKEEWSLEEGELRKGEGDEKDGDEGVGGKKTRGRRA